MPPRLSIDSQLERLASGATPYKYAARVVTTAAPDFAGLDTIGGVALAEGDRVLVAVGSSITNGLWVASSGAWYRPEDFSSDLYVKVGAIVPVLEGVSAGLWLMTAPTTGRPRLGETALTFGRIDVDVSVYSTFKDSVRVVADSAITTSGLQTVDGVAVQAGDRVLVAAQASAVANGIYIAGVGTWVRASDFDSSDDVRLGSTFRVLEGTDYGGSIWTMTSPTTGTVTVGVTALVFAEVETGGAASTNIEPSGDTTGVSDRNAILERLSGGQDADLSVGSYYLSARIDIPAGRTLRLNGATILRGTSWVNTSVDDRTGSVFRVAGAASGTVNTTLSATVKVQTASLPFASASGANLPAAGSWVKVTGIVTPFGSDTAAVTAGELCQVSTSYVSGTTVTLEERKAISAQSASTVVSIAPNIGARVIGPGTLDWTGGIAAVGIEVTDAYDVVINDVSFRGFTRAPIDARHSKLISVPRMTIHGDCNGGMFTDSCQFVLCGEQIATGRYGRRHASGIPRYMFWSYNHSVKTEILNASWRKVCGGHRQWGGLHCGVHTWSAHDLDITDVIANAPALESGNVPATTPIGIVHDGGAGPINQFTAFGMGCFFGDGVATGIIQPDPKVQATIYIHDHHEFAGGNWTIVNGGADSDVAGSYMTGVSVKDATGTVNSVTARGVSYAFAGYGFPTVTFTEAAILANSGDGSLSTVAVFLNYAGGTGNGLRFGRLKIDNMTNWLGVGADYHSNPDKAILIGKLDLSGKEFTDVAVVRAAPTGFVDLGYVATINSAATPEATESVGPSIKNVVYCSGRADTDPYVGSYAAVAFGDACLRYDDADPVVATLDLLVSEAASPPRVIIDNTPPSGSVVWQAIRPDSGGFVQAKKVGVIP